MDVDRVEAMVLERLNAKDGAGLFALYGDAMRTAVPLDKTEEFVRAGSVEWGSLTDATTPRHHATYSIKTDHGAWQLELTIDDHGAIQSMLLHPRPTAPPVAESAIPLSLPFKGKWTVAWGGNSADVNIHVKESTPGVPWSQRRAADLVVQGWDGKSFRGDGKKNEDYLAYGLPILAVADGQVVTVIDGVPENEPGTLNALSNAGNAVVIRHTDSLYSFYAHLQPGKIKVKVGAKVKRGEVLGLCGNSGNASEPHLHCHLEDGPRFESSWGVLARFSGVKVTRARVTAKDDAYVFLKGDVIESAN
jgi:hypothetical protein